VNKKILKVYPTDNVWVALVDLEPGDIAYKSHTYAIKEFIPAKHKFAETDIEQGNDITMYGVLVGRAKSKIKAGCLLSTDNVIHASTDFFIGKHNTTWNKPDVAKWKDKTFMGYHRDDGSVGTGNYWLIIPMVFCENRNIQVLEEALVNTLGYGNKKLYVNKVQKLVDLIKTGGDINEVLYTEVDDTNTPYQNKVFPNVDGIKFLTHDGGCGGIRQDADTLCGLLAGYITHPNVAGTTILSLGCQNAQVSILEEEINKRSPAFNKPLYILEQQKIGTESDFLDIAIRQTLAGLIEANKCFRKAAPLNKLIIGLECGGSDGFSGISANPAIGYTSDLIVALGGSVILSEFPELCGAEQDLINRCVDDNNAKHFSELIKTYSIRAEEAGSGFDKNPSPGNIKDGLITDAIKSAGAAKKGGTSPVTDVLDYPEKVIKAGLNLLCTPGNDVESTTAEVGAGAQVVLFTTGLGTPTGNPIAPVIKISSNSKLYNTMGDIIDIDTGSIIEGNETIEKAGERIFDYIIEVASGNIEVASVRNGQNDFIPWKRGISL